LNRIRPFGYFASDCFRLFVATLDAEPGLACEQEVLSGGFRHGSELGNVDVVCTEKGNTRILTAIRCLLAEMVCGLVPERLWFVFKQNF
jgi:hypothetical protein